MSMAKGILDKRNKLFTMRMSQRELTNIEFKASKKGLKKAQFLRSKLYK